MPEAATRNAATSSGWSHCGDSLTLPQVRVADTPDEPRTPDGGVYCATCRGARWLKRLDFDPCKRYGDDRGLVRCPDCEDSQRAARINRLAAMAGLSDEQRRQTFANLKPVRGLSEAVKAAAGFAQEPRGWLVIWGAPGSGKTHLSLAVANALIAREQAVVWRYVPDVVYRMRELVSLQEPDTITPTLLDAPVLILDDLGAARWTDYVTERLELVFDRRYRDRAPTMVTLIGADRPRPDYDLAEDVKRTISVSIGRRMQDSSACRIVRNAAPQWRGDAT